MRSDEGPEEDQEMQVEVRSEQSAVIGRAIVALARL